MSPYKGLLLLFDLRLAEWASSELEFTVGEEVAIF